MSMFFKEETHVGRHTENYTLIVDAIGKDATKKLCDMFGGEALYIPLPSSLNTAQRIACIRREVTPYNVPEVSRRYGITTRRVQQILQETQKDKDA